jgi:hypothetical protein
VPHVPRDGLEWTRKIWRRRVLLRSELHWDPAFTINSQNSDTFATWEWDVEHRAG